MSYDPPAYVAKFAETRKLPFGVVIDNTGLIANSSGHHTTIEQDEISDILISTREGL